MTIETADGSTPSPPGLDERVQPQRWEVGDSVTLLRALRYLKTADPMPMLRPPDLVEASETGVVVEIRALDQVAVRFRRGTFLLAAGDLTRPVGADRPGDG